jgi:hypothetical protein
MEDIINTIDNKVQIIFERTSITNMTFRDALWFTQAEYDALTPENILTLQQERFDNWEALVNSPPTEPSDVIEV